MKTALVIAGLLVIAGGILTSIWFVQPRSVPQQPPTITDQRVEPLAIRDGDLITKPDGWPIPDISNLQKNSPRGRWKREQNRVKIYSTSYDPKGLQLAKMNFDGTVDGPRKVEINSLTVFDIDKRPFCYRMLFWNVPLEGESGITAVIYHSYYDLDGDGKFETWDIKDTSFSPLRMPNWIGP